MSHPDSPSSQKSRGNIFDAQLSKIKGVTDCLILIRERWPIGLAIGLLIAGLVIFQEARKPNIYQSTAELRIELQQERVLNIPSVRLPLMFIEQEMEAQINIMRSRRFTDYVIESLTPTERTLIVQAYKTAENPDPSIKEIIRSANRITRDPRSIIIKVSFAHRDPEAAALLANRHASRFIDFVTDSARLSNRAALVFLEEQSEDLQVQLETLRRELQSYRQRYNLVSLEESQNIVVERLKTLSASLTGAKVRVLELSAALELVAEAKEEGMNLSTLPVVAQYGSIAQISSQIEALRTTRDTLSRRYLERHPRMIDNARELESLQELLQENIASAISDLRNRHTEARNQLANLERELANAEEQAFLLDQRAVEYDILRQNLRSKESLYAEVTRRMNETSVSSQLDRQDLSIIEEASPSYTPISPQVQRATVVAIMLFLMAFTGVPILLEFFSHKISTHWDIEVFLNQRLLTDVPKVGQMSKKEKRPFHVIKESDDELDESFRAAYGVIAMHSTFDFPKTILVASADASEGKTFVASQLGLTFSRHNHRTLLFDCDFRRPSLHQNFSIANKQGFLTAWNAQTQNTSVPHLCSEIRKQVVEIAPNLFILPTGGSTREATQIFSDSKFDKVIFDLKQHFDCVFFDTCPAGIFPDSLSLSKHVDELVFVTQHERTNRHHAKQTVSTLLESKVHLLGVVMNGISRSKLGRYGSYGYGGYYNYQKQRSYYAQKS